MNYENVKWTHLPPDDIDNMMKHAKANGYVDKFDTIRVDFSDLCGLLKGFRELSQQKEKCTCGAMAASVAKITSCPNCALALDAEQRCAMCGWTSEE